MRPQDSIDQKAKRAKFLFATQSNPIKPLCFEDGTKRYGTHDTAILIKPDGSVAFMLRSRSLKAIWKSLAGRLGATDGGAHLDPVVFELASMPLKTWPTVKTADVDLSYSMNDEIAGHMLSDLTSPDIESDFIDLNLPNVLTALREMLSQSAEHTFERKRDQLMRQINAAWAIKHRVSAAHQKFLHELKRLTQKLGCPPTKRKLAEAIKCDAKRMSQLCQDLSFDWLPTERPGPKRSMRKRRRS